MSEVNIENGVKYIESWAFNGSFNAFSGCYNLTEIYIPSSIIRIENNAFAGCSNLMNIIVDNNNVQYSSYEGSLYNKEGYILIICPQGKQSFEISPNGTVIQNNAFDFCTKLEEIVLSDDIKKLPSGVFSDCINLKKFNVPNGVESLYRTFYKCSNLETVYIPISVKNISSDTFYRCYNLKEIIYAGTQEQWDSIRIDDGNAELSNVKITYLGNGSTTEPDVALQKEYKKVANKIHIHQQKSFVFYLQLQQKKNGKKRLRNLFKSFLNAFFNQFFFAAY